MERMSERICHGIIIKRSAGPEGECQKSQKEATIHSNFEKKPTGTMKIEDGYNLCRSTAFREISYKLQQTQLTQDSGWNEECRSTLESNTKLNSTS